MNHFTYVHCCSNWYPICVSLLKSTEFSIMNLFLQKWISHLLEIYSVNITVFGIWSSVSLIRKWYVALCQVLICFYSVELFLALFVFQYSIIKWQFLFWNKAIFRCVCVCVWATVIANKINQSALVSGDTLFRLCNKSKLIYHSN